MQLLRRGARSEAATAAPPTTPAEPQSGGDTGSQPGRVALFWIRLVNKNIGAAHLVSSVIVFFVLYAVTEAANIRPDAHNVLTGVLIAVLTAALVIAVPLLGTVVALQRPLRAVLRIVGQATAGAPILPFLGDNLDEMQKDLLELRGDGAILESYQVAAWVRRCFKVATGQYIGTDRHFPSTYQELYSDYLAAHEEYLHKTGSTASARLLLTEIESLRTDRNEFPAAFDEFMIWHTVHPVSLLYLTPRENQQLLEPEDLPFFEETDIGFWRGDFVLFFSPPPARSSGDAPPVSTKVRLRLALHGEPAYDRCANYVTRLLKETRFGTNAPRAVKDELPIYSEELSENWRRFCDPPKRLAQTGPFLDSVLSRFGHEPRQIKVLDAATGIGVEAVHLLKQGYFLMANEIEPALRLAARAYANEQGTTIPEAHFANLDWLRLREGMPDNQYDAIYVLGNSLCHLEAEDQVERALNNFHSVLAPGGLLICDERNFDYITREWNVIADDPWNRFRFNRRTSKIMYHGDQVMGAPVERRNGRVIFEYAEVTRKPSGIVPTRRLGDLNMLAFKKGSLKRKLESKFASVEVYCDLMPSSTRELDDAADFFTYVATKAGSRPSRDAPAA